MRLPIDAVDAGDGGDEQPDERAGGESAGGEMMMMMMMMLLGILEGVPGRLAAGHPSVNSATTLGGSTIFGQHCTPVRLRSRTNHSPQDGKDERRDVCLQSNQFHRLRHP